MSFDNVLSGSEDVTTHLLPKFNLNLDDKWLTTSKLIACLEEIEDKIGPETLKRIGRKVGLAAASTQGHEIKSFDTFFLQDINILYKENHIMLENGFLVHKNDESFIVDLSNNPYPLTFNQGLLSGFSFNLSRPSLVSKINQNYLEIKNLYQTAI